MPAMHGLDRQLAQALQAGGVMLKVGVVGIFDQANAPPKKRVVCQIGSHPLRLTGVYARRVTASGRGDSKLTITKLIKPTARL